MAIWKQTFTLESLNALNARTAGSACGIVFTDCGADYLIAEMPVDERHVQPYRILHGGMNVVLAETVGSIASTLCIQDLNKHMAVGIEVNANHLRAVREGEHVKAVCKPIRVGRAVQVWQVEIFDSHGRLSCISRLTTAIVPRIQGDAVFFK